jgi:Tripartite tricarboxylate transporter TctB family
MIARILFPAAIAAIAIPFGVIAWNYPAMPLQDGFGPGLFPLIIAITIGGLALCEMVVQLASYSSVQSTDPTEVDHDSKSVTLGELRAVALLVLAVVGTVFAVRHVGFIAAGSGLLFLLSIAMGMRPFWLAALSAIGATVFFYLIFAKMFGLVMAF